MRLLETKSENSLAAGWKHTTASGENGSFSLHRSVSGVSGFLKRSIDCVLAALGLIVLAPVFAVMAVIIKATDGGAVLYRQTRAGYHGRHFTIIKFRTMHEHAERDLGPIWAVPHDPRCTRAGYCLRRMGLDELPQLWNILRGDMSFVGPRPERPHFTSEFREQYREYEVREIVRPGLTGYAQIHGWRGFTSLEERLRHDLFYVRNWSLTLDMYIFGMTAIRGWSERTTAGAVCDRAYSAKPGQTARS